MLPPTVNTPPVMTPWGPANMDTTAGHQTVTDSVSSNANLPAIPVGPGNPAPPAVFNGGATAKSAHEMIVATAIMIVVVYLLVIVAGMSKGAGRAVLALFGMAIVIQGLGHTAAVFNFVNSKPLTRK